jgi:carbonic anhydrase
MHLVHYNQKYGNITNAMNRDDGLAVVAVFLNAVGFGLFPFEDYALTPIINTLPLITNFNTSTNFFGPLLLNSLLPIDRTRFYRYNGSLTTPPCSQTVTFLIYEKPIDISKNKVKV